MKPPTISTDRGLFVLDSTGFYIPYEEPEPKSSGLWLWVWAASGLGVIGGLICLAWFGA